MKQKIFLCIFILTSTLLISEQQLIILGAVDSNAPLYMPIQVEEGSDGNIYVFDAKDSFIKVYSPEGTFLQNMAGKGEGPGEFLRLGEFGFTSDNLLFFTEMLNGHPWITLLQLSGKLDKVIKLKINRQFGIWRAVGLPEKRFLAEIHYRDKYIKKGNTYYSYYSRELVLVNSSGEIEQMLLKKDDIFSISYAPEMPDKRVPFFPEFLWGINKNDGRIIFSEGNSNIIMIYDLKGNLLKKTNTSLPEAPTVTSEDLDYWRESIKKRFFNQLGNEGFKKYYGMIYNYKNSIYPKKPFISHLCVTGEGKIFLRGYSRNDKAKSRVYWLLDKDGKELFHFVSKADSIGISQHFVFCVIKDDEDNKLVYLIKRKNSEIEDLRLFKNKLESSI